MNLERVRDVLAFIILAGALSTIVSASIGVASLYAGGIVASSTTGETWRAWWLGDMMGNLLVGALLLVWAGRRRSPSRSDTAEGMSLLVAVILATILIFDSPPGPVESSYGQAYMFFPLLIWASVRFEQAGATAASFAISVIAIMQTTLGHGPFVRRDLSDSLVALQTFMAVVASTFLILGASVAERRRAAREVQVARESAEDANRAKSDFLAVMSHELRTPLNAIAGYVDLLSLEVNGPLTEGQRDSLLRISRSGKHLLALIDDVLSFARLEAGSLSLEIGTHSASEAVESIGPIMEPEFRKKNLTFVSESEDRTITVRADAERLRQILLNLFVNAVKFTPEGGRISSGVERNGSMVKIAVRDSGIGIPEDQIGRVFDPFVQLDSGSTRKYPGVGLGLSISRDLARAMGDLYVETKLGEGSTFSVLLPRA